MTISNHQRNKNIFKLKAYGTLQILNTLRIMITVLFLVILVYHFSTLFPLLHIFINHEIQQPQIQIRQASA